MGDFRRSQSKVWWSSFPTGDEPHERSWSKPLNVSSIPTVSLEKKDGIPGEADAAAGNWSSPEISRGESSSPSQGSHKSQDSGFSDSELQNAASCSPQDSPDLSKRLSETDPANTVNETPHQQRLKTPPIKKFQYHLVEFSQDIVNSDRGILETDFEISGPDNSPASRRNQYAQSSADNEKINKIQNKLELSFKLPKKVNSLVSNVVNQEKKEDFDEVISLTDGNTSESVRSSCSEFTVIEQPLSRSAKIQDVSSWVSETTKRSAPELDRDGFKIPKCVSLKGSCTSLNFSENPPVSCSTPKSSRACPASPLVLRPARAKEKIIGTKSFATVRKLKGLSDCKPKRSAHVQKVLSRGHCIEEKDSRHSVAQWLQELEELYEAEIMTTLQSKSLATDLTRQVTNMAATTSETVRKLHHRTKVISSEFSKLCQHIKCKKYNQVGPLVQSLVGHIKEFMTEYVLNQSIAPAQTSQRNENCNKISTCSETEQIADSADKPKVMTEQPKVLLVCEKLREFSCQRHVDHDAVEKHRLELAKEFREVVDEILLSHVRALVDVLEEPRTELVLRTALSALCTLGLEGSQLSALVARCEGVRALLAVCLEARATAVRVSALRALATVCCVSDTVRKFQEAGGIEILSDILTDRNRSEPELSEAAAVLAQITAPWMEDCPPLPELSEHLPAFISSLTYLIETFKSSETLLLTSAALANLTFLEPRTVWSLVEHGTARVLLEAVRRQGPKVSVFIQEQAATVIANMAAIPECRGHLAQYRAVVALLCFLQIRHSPLQRTAEISSAERVQQKTAIALSRLCSDSVVAKQVVELHGVNRLVRLCKDERERNHSDGVLVACLAALRKIVANCGTEVIEQLNASELIEPRLLDSFLLYSSRQESYV